jgi:hypothetical protein
MAIHVVFLSLNILKCLTQTDRVGVGEGEDSNPEGLILKYKKSTD